MQSLGFPAVNLKMWSTSGQERAQWRDLTDRELESTYLEAAAQHFQWRIDEMTVQDDCLYIKGWALALEGQPQDARFLINGKDFDCVQYPLPSSDIERIYWNVPSAATARFACSTVVRWEESYPDGFARIEFFDGSNSHRVRRRAWYLPNPRVELPIPEGFRIRRVIGAADPENYLIGGAAVYKRLEDYLREIYSQTFEHFGRILDWACGCGRVGRNFRWCPSRYYGVDIDGDNIAWCRKHLPHGEFMKSGTLPPLPYESAFFDMVMAIGILDQMSEESQSLWLRELKRVLKKDGLLLVSATGLTRSDWPGHIRTCCAMSKKRASS